MHKEFGRIKGLLIKVHQEQKKGWRSRDLNEVSKKNYDILITTKSPMVQDEIIHRFSDVSQKPKTNFGDSSNFFYLPPLNDNPEFIPLLTFHCDFNRTPEKFSYQLHMYCFGTEGPLSLGFRFEGPHGTADGESGHVFYHVQSIKKLKGCANSKIEGSIDWYPDKMPTIPLLAKNSTSLLLNMLISLYGVEWVRSLIKGCAINEDDRGPLIDLLPNPNKKEKEKKSKKIVANHKKKKNKK